MVCLVHCQLFRSPWGLQSQKSNVWQVDTNSPAKTVHPWWLPPLVRICSLSESLTCHTNVGLSENQLPYIPTLGYATSIEPPCDLNICLMCWSPDSAQTVPSPAALRLLRILATKYYHLHCIPDNPLHMPLYGHISVFARSHMFDEIE